MATVARHASTRFRHYVLRLWESRGGGFYGFVAVLTFLYLEATDLAGDLAGLADAAILDLGWIIGWFVDRLLDAIFIAIWSAAWPLAWIQQFGVNLLSAALLLGAWGLYRLIRPGVLRFLRAGIDEAGETPKTTAPANPRSR